MRHLIACKSDEELWTLLPKNNREAFALLYQRNIQTLFNFGLKLTSDRELIKDTLQELFTEFWKKRNTLSDVQLVKIYLIKSFRYKLLRTIAKSNKTRTYNLEELLTDMPDLELTENELALERQKLLKKQLQRLSERQREVIHLRYFQNLNHEEIADIMNMNYQSVSNLLHRALKKLRAELSEKTPKTKKLFQK